MTKRTPALPTTTSPSPDYPEGTIASNQMQARKKRMQRFAERYETTAPAPRVTLAGKTQVDIANAEALAWAEACGTVNTTFATQLLNDLLTATKYGNELQEAKANATLAAVAGVAPKDETEAMLAAQMVATHHAAMKTLGLAMRDEGLNVAQWRSGFAIKLLRTYTMQMEALQRYRGKGEQKMTVEHVHVHAGGQAIVGHVTGGGGVPKKEEDQPHAAHLTHTPSVLMSEVSGQDAQGDALPVPCHAERTLPDARRLVHRSARRKPKRP